MAGSAAIGGLTSGQTYYAILIGPNQIELADSLANALGGQALALDFSKAGGSQTFLPITFTINAATQTIVVSVAGGVALSRQQTGSFSSNNAIAGALSTDDIIDKTKAYLENAMVTTAALDVTADHGGYIGSLTAGAAGATGGTGSNNAVAGSVSVDVDLPVTEAYVQDATLTLGGDSSVKANEAAEIAAIAGSGAYGGSKGFGVAIAINLIGFNLDGTSDPATTAAFIQDSTVTLDTGTLSITATDAGPTIQPQIIAITGSGGVATGSDSIGGGGMIAVNDIQDETNAYVVGSTITQPSGASALANLDVEATDSSGIIAIGGALGVGGEAGLGAAIGFNVIAATTSAYIDSSTIDVNGTVTVTATDTAVIGSATIGVGVTTGDGGLAGAGSVSINQITDTTDAHISNTLDTTSSVTAGGTVTVTAKDTSTIGSVAGGVAGASEGAAVGAAISYNLIQNSILAYVDDSTVTTGGDLDLSATSSPVLVAVAVGAAGTGSGFALGGSITVNAIANDVDTHISDSTVDAHGSVSLMAIESAVMVVVAGAVAISLEGAAVGGAIAYNYIGGSFDPANPDLTGTASTTTSMLQAPGQRHHHRLPGDGGRERDRRGRLRPAPRAARLGRLARLRVYPGDDPHRRQLGARQRGRGRRGGPGGRGGGLAQPEFRPRERRRLDHHGQRGAGGREWGRLGHRVRLRHDRGRQRRAGPRCRAGRGRRGRRRHLGRPQRHRQHGASLR